jgi:hypothetical protein
MRNRLPLAAAVLCAAALAAAPAAAQGQPSGPAGHWVGTLQTPGQPLDVEVDLKPGAPPAWIGTISIAAQNLKAFPLSSITVKDKAVSFAMANVPGTPTFTGTLSDDGATLSGDFVQGGGSIPFTMTRKGDAVFAPPVKSTAIGKELEGTWNGALSAGGRLLRLTLKLASGPDGATGSIVSVDQDNTEIAITTIVQEGSHLTLELPSIAGTFAGDLKDGKLVGTWAQGPGKVPLEFSRPVP